MVHSLVRQFSSIGTVPILAIAIDYVVHGVLGKLCESRLIIIKF